MPDFNMLMETPKHSRTERIYVFSPGEESVKDDPEIRDTLAIINQVPIHSNSRRVSARKPPDKRTTNDNHGWFEQSNRF